MTASRRLAAGDLGEEDAGNVGGGGSPNGHIEELEQLQAMELGPISAMERGRQ